MPHQPRSIKKNLSQKSKRSLDLSIEKGVSNCLTALLISDFGFQLLKQHFWDAIRLQYGWSIATLPATWHCGSRLSIQHYMSCNLRNLTAKMLSEVCIEIESIFRFV